jgi:beta propeller repeat protein
VAQRRSTPASLLRLIASAVAVAVVAWPAGARAAQQFQGLCAFVKIEILQELTLERVGFLATLEITNNEGDASISDFSAQLTFNNFATHDEASDLFFVRPPTLSGIAAVDGTGIIKPGETARIEWFIIPKISAGGDTPAGVRYSVGAQLGGSIYGQEIAQSVLTVIPDAITVLPEPQLEITYFQPRDVDGDDPFTPDVVEAPVPFPLGLLVKNAGFGRARDVQIVSEQPRIVDNKQALVLIAQLLGARVDDAPTDHTSLTLNLGDIDPGKCRKGAWDMITTLSGQFIDFKASYTHSSDLGGRDTSIIKQIHAYFIVHEVLNDQPGRDQLKDFLADTVLDTTAQDVRAQDIIPDTLFESDCTTLPVNQLKQVQVTPQDDLTAVVSAVADFDNWVYLRVDDPQQNKLKIVRVVRSDGKVLNPNNYWTSTHYRFPDNKRLDFLHIFDFVALGQYTYTVTYEASAPDHDPPQTRLRFAGEVQEVNGEFVIRPETQMYFTVEDASPVVIFYKLETDTGFLPGLPFSIDQPGEHVVEYFSRDRAGNEDTHQFATLVLSPDFPEVVDLVTDPQEMFISGDALSVRPAAVAVSFSGGNTLTTTSASVEVYRGVLGFPVLDGVPSSPTRRSDATVTVSGDNVDYYRYRLNGGAWSQESPVAQPIALGSLAGPNALEVNGRSGYGDYLPDVQAVKVEWTVDAGADPAVVVGPSTPNRSTSATIAVSGSSYYCYRVDGNFYRPEPAGGAPIELSRLSEGRHTVEVRTRTGAEDPCPGNVPGNAVSWVIDRSYGFELPASALVRTEVFPNISGTVHADWDGRDQSGRLVAQGWYSVQVTVTDGLGRSTSAIRLVRVGDMLEETLRVSETEAPQTEPHAAGHWAAWQDQRNDNWDVFALDLKHPAASPLRVTTDSHRHERPRTDGTFVVWEDRQADGTWDVWAWRLGSSETAFAVTQTPGFDERRPAIDWPWVVFQRRPVSVQGTAWQVVAVNLVTQQLVAVDPTNQDQLDPAVNAGRVVWQDLRDLGAGDIYLKDLQSGEVRRITNDPAAQIQPSISDNWVVWVDNRAGSQLDLYGFNLKRGVELQITHTPQNEARPHLNGRWLVYTDNSTGAGNENLRLLHLSNFAAVQLTNSVSAKDKPSTAEGKLVWQDRNGGRDRVLAGSLPDLQPVFGNANVVAVTQGMASFQRDAYTLLRLWNTGAGVTEITRYTSLLPVPVAETAVWQAGGPAGDNFPLEAGGFLWVKFGSAKTLELGPDACDPIDLNAGVNAFSYSCFPDRYSAYQLLRELGLSNVKAIRGLDAESGRWSVATVSAGAPVGADFEIPRVAAVFIDMNAPVSRWQPGQE